MKTSIYLQLIAMLCIAAHDVHSQNEVEALRYSTCDPALSARSMGMNGAYSAVGVDMSSFFCNPAGLAVYKRTNIEGALEHNSHLTESTYTGESHKELKSRLSIGNAGFVAVRGTRSPHWKNISYGIAFAKTNNFYQNFTIEGKAETTIMQQFAWQAQGIAPADLYNTYSFTAGPAYEVYGIDPADEAGTYYVPATFGLAHQTKRIQREGRQNETSFALAGNLEDRIFIGGSLNITGIYFTELTNYTESYASDARVSSISFNEDLTTSGTGFAAHVGIIYKAKDWLRISASHQTKTATYLQDIYSSKALSEVGIDSYASESPQLNSDYSLRSPAKSTFGAAGIVGKYGIVSIDYETADYTRIRMKGTDANTYDYKAENQLYQQIFRRTNQLRIGIESRILSTYYVRAGYGIQQHPFSDEAAAIHAAINSWSVGVGYRDDHFFADMALRSYKVASTYYLYDPALVQPATVNDRATKVMLSVGFRF